MHDTVTRIRKLIRTGEVAADAAMVFSQGFQNGGLSKALAEPLATHLELISADALRWTQAAQKLSGQTGDAKTALLEMMFASKRLAVSLDDLVPFLERAEENLEGDDDITHRESSYEKEVGPFSRHDSTQDFRNYLQETAQFSVEAAGIGAQAEGDLMKIVYLEKRLRDMAPSTADLYAMIVELGLDARRHLVPAFAPDSTFMTALTAAARR